MKVQRLFGGALAALALSICLGSVLPVSVSALDEKVTICHATGNPFHWNAITVSVNSGDIASAVAGHVDANGQPEHFRKSWGGADFLLPGEATDEDCKDAGPKPKP